MTTLNLKPETQAGLLALSHETGMSFEEHLLSVVEAAVISRSAHTLTPEQRAAAWRETAAAAKACIPIADR